MIPSTDGAKHSAPHTPSGRRLNHSSPAPWGPLAALILCLSALSACHGDCPAASVGEGTAATSQGGETQAGTSPGPAEGTQSRAEGSGLPGDTTGSREGSSTADPGQNQPPLGPENLPWLGTLTYSHPERLDFSKSTEMEIRSVTFTKLDLSSGETLRILSPELFGEDADQYFYWEAFEVAPTPFDEDVPIDNDWSSKSMKSVKSLRFDITYLPPVDPTQEIQNAELRFIIEKYLEWNADESTRIEEHIAIDLLAGPPAGKLELAPKQPINVSVYSNDGASGARHVVLYNQGNGPLVIEDVTLTYPDERDVWRFTLEGLPSFPYQIDTRDLLVLNLGWQAPYTEAISIPCEATLSVSYLNPYSQALETRELEVAQVFNNPTFNVELMRGDGQGPVAVGTEVWLDASQSSVSISSAYALYLFSYQWYLIDKPAGSWAKLNKSWGDLQAFSPDLPGDYTVELIVTAYSENFLSVAEPTQLTITAQ